MTNLHHLQYLLVMCLPLFFNIHVHVRVALGPVVQTLVNANLGLNFNPGFFFFLSKALSQTIFSIFFSVSNHQILGKRIQLNWLFKLSYLSSKFALTLSYLYPASNSTAQNFIGLCLRWLINKSNLSNQDEWQFLHDSYFSKLLLKEDDSIFLSCYLRMQNLIIVHVDIIY